MSKLARLGRTSVSLGRVRLFAADLQLSVHHFKPDALSDTALTTYLTLRIFFSMNKDRRLVIVCGV